MSKRFTGPLTVALVLRLAAGAGHAEDGVKIYDQFVFPIAHHGQLAMQGGDPVSPAGDPMDDLTTVVADAEQERDQRIPQEVEADIEAENRLAQVPAETIGPATPTENWEAAKARAERFGDAIEASEAAESRLAAAQNRLEAAQQAEAQLRAQSASYNELQSVRLATSDAQAEVWQAQSGVDVADLNLRAARHELDMAYEIETATGVVP
ncbi:MAG: hypothetical protein ACXVBB_19825, partial [Isosphaeraceae bacterium]